MARCTSLSCDSFSSSISCFANFVLFSCTFFSSFGKAL
nr:MAG TPA: hypothetical protein [Caudoviricetes sp.]